MLALVVMVTALVTCSQAAREIWYVDCLLGEDFYISLESNPTTGYSWAASFDEEALTLVDQTHVPYEQPSGLMGGGGRDLFTFQGLRPGETTVKMTYSRPWENATMPKIRTYVVRVAEDNTTLINTTMGQDVLITLHDNSASTGYTWAASFNSSQLQLIGETYDQYLPNTMVVGSGGLRTFEFAPLVPGEAEVVMKLNSPEGMVERAWTFKIAVA
ncbi:MAG: protease inhibitor I42 family protein [Methanosarcinales archaeon]|nr:protease inhibitor I42 family protein [Methanosarcinales archaeon]